MTLHKSMQPTQSTHTHHRAARSEDHMGCCGFGNSTDHPQEDGENSFKASRKSAIDAASLWWRWQSRSMMSEWEVCVWLRGGASNQDWEKDLIKRMKGFNMFLNQTAEYLFDSDSKVLLLASFLFSSWINFFFCLTPISPNLVTSHKTPFGLCMGCLYKA